MKTASKTLHGEIAKVERVFVGFEDHNIFTIAVELGYGGAHQSFGGYALDEWSQQHQRRLGTAAGMDMLVQLTKLFQVDDLHRAVGKYVYALREEPRTGVVVGLKRLEPDGGEQFLIAEWRAQWFSTEPTEAAHG